MAKSRKRRIRVERLRAQPLRQKMIQLQRPVKEKLISRKMYVKNLTYIINKKNIKPLAISRPLMSITNNIPCKNKKAKARHNYFSMRSAGKGAKRLNKPLENRFTVRC